MAGSCKIKTSLNLSGLGKEITMADKYDLADTDDTLTMTTKQQRTLAVAGTEERLSLGGISGLVYMKILDYDLDIDTSYSGDTFSSELTVKAGESQIFRPAGTIYVKNTNISETPKYLYCIIGTGEVVDLTSVCIAHYKMNDNTTSTIIIDSQEYSDGDAQQNTEDLHTTGKIGGALASNGSSDYIDCNDTFESVFQSDYSIGFWVKPTDGRPDSQEVFCGTFDVAIENGIEIIIHSVGLIGYSGASNNVSFSSFSSAAVFSDGQQDWHYILLVVKQTSATDTTVYLYFDGELVREKLHSGVILEDYVNPANFYIGAFNAGGSPMSFFDGPLDNVMLFNKALSQTEIDFLYYNGNGTEELANI